MQVHFDNFCDFYGTYKVSVKQLWALLVAFLQIYVDPEECSLQEMCFNSGKILLYLVWNECIFYLASWAMVMVVVKCIPRKSRCDSRAHLQQAWHVRQGESCWDTISLSESCLRGPRLGTSWSITTSHKNFTAYTPNVRRWLTALMIIDSAEFMILMYFVEYNYNWRIHLAKFHMSHAGYETL